MSKCSLCEKDSKLYLKTDHPSKVEYLKCSNCDLIYVDSKFHVEHDDEKSRYTKHENHIRTQGYEKFLLNSINPLRKYINSEMKGLDFGCGPYPMLVEIMKDEGFEMDFSDPHFFPDNKLSEAYDFITCTEVVEHFNNPLKSWNMLTSFLKTGSYLSIMTSFHDDITDLDSWYYRFDPTHVSFYSSKTLLWLCNDLSLELLHKTQNTAVFVKI